MGAAKLGLLSKLYSGENAQEGLVGKSFQEQLNAMLKLPRYPGRNLANSVAILD